MMKGWMVSLATGLALAACAQPTSTAAPPPPVAGTELPPPPFDVVLDTPEMALLRHVLVEHFATPRAASVTTCATVRGTGPAGPLPRDIEQALMTSLPELAPYSRCVWREGRYVDAITGGNAVLFEVSGVTCENKNRCTGRAGWIAANLGAEYEEYAIERIGGQWRFTPTGVRIMS